MKLFILVGMLLFSFNLFALEEYATVTKVVGNVQYNNYLVTLWQKIPVGSKITTSSKSMVTLENSSGESLTIGPKQSKIIEFAQIKQSNLINKTKQLVAMDANEKKNDNDRPKYKTAGFGIRGLVDGTSMFDNWPTLSLFTTINKNQLIYGADVQIAYDHDVYFNLSYGLTNNQSVINLIGNYKIQTYLQVDLHYTIEDHDSFIGPSIVVTKDLQFNYVKVSGELFNSINYHFNTLTTDFNYGINIKFSLN